MRLASLFSGHVFASWDRFTETVTHPLKNGSEFVTLRVFPAEAHF
jgi:hypothetical protein